MNILCIPLFNAPFGNISIIFQNCGTFLKACFLNFFLKLPFSKQMCYGKKCKGKQDVLFCTMYFAMPDDVPKVGNVTQDFSKVTWLLELPRKILMLCYLLKERKFLWKFLYRRRRRRAIVVVEEEQLSLSRKSNRSCRGWAIVVVEEEQSSLSRKNNRRRRERKIVIAKKNNRPCRFFLGVVVGNQNIPSVWNVSVHPSVQSFSMKIFRLCKNCPSFWKFSVHLTEKVTWIDETKKYKNFDILGKFLCYVT